MYTGILLLIFSFSCCSNAAERGPSGKCFDDACSEPLEIAHVSMECWVSINDDESQKVKVDKNAEVDVLFKSATGCLIRYDTPELETRVGSVARTCVKTKRAFYGKSVPKYREEALKIMMDNLAAEKGDAALDGKTEPGFLDALSADATPTLRLEDAQFPEVVHRDLEVGDGRLSQFAGEGSQELPEEDKGPDDAPSPVDSEQLDIASTEAGPPESEYLDDSASDSQNEIVGELSEEAIKEETGGTPSGHLAPEEPNKFTAGKPESTETEMRAEKTAPDATVLVYNDDSQTSDSLQEEIDQPVVSEVVAPQVTRQTSGNGSADIKDESVEVSHTASPLVLDTVSDPARSPEREDSPSEAQPDKVPRQPDSPPEAQPENDPLQPESTDEKLGEHPEPAEDDKKSNETTNPVEVETSNELAKPAEVEKPNELSSPAVEKESSDLPNPTKDEKSIELPNPAINKESTDHLSPAEDIAASDTIVPAKVDSPKELPPQESLQKPASESTEVENIAEPIKEEPVPEDSATNEVKSEEIELPFVENTDVDTPKSTIQDQPLTTDESQNTQTLDIPEEDANQGASDVLEPANTEQADNSVAPDGVCTAEDKDCSEPPSPEEGQSFKPDELDVLIDMFERDPSASEVDDEIHSHDISHKQAENVTEYVRLLVPSFLRSQSDCEKLMKELDRSLHYANENIVSPACDEHDWITFVCREKLFNAQLWVWILICVSLAFPYYLIKIVGSMVSETDPLAADVSVMEQRALAALREKEAMKRQIDSHDAEKSMFSEQYKILKENCDQLASKKAHLDESHQELLGLYRDAENLVKELQAKEHQLSSLLRHKESLISEQEQQLAGATNAKQAAEADLCHLHNKMTTMSNTCDSLTVEINELRRALDNQKTDNLSLQQQLTDAQIRYDLLQENKIALVEKVTALEGHLADRDATISSLQSDIELLKSSFTMAPPASSSNSGWEEADLDDADNLARVEQLFNAVKISKELTEVKAERDRLDTQLQTEMANHVSLKDRLRVAEKKAADCELRLREAQIKFEAIDKYQKETEQELRRQIAETEQERLSREKLLHSSQTSQSTLEEDCITYKRQVEQLKEELQKMDVKHGAEITKLENSVHQSWVQSRNLEKKLQMKRQENDTLRKKLTQIQGENVPERDENSTDRKHKSDSKSRKSRSTRSSSPLEELFDLPPPPPPPPFMSMMAGMGGPPGGPMMMPGPAGVVLSPPFNPMTMYPQPAPGYDPNGVYMSPGGLPPQAGMDDHDLRRHSAEKPRDHRRTQEDSVSDHHRQSHGRSEEISTSNDQPQHAIHNGSAAHHQQYYPHNYGVPPGHHVPYEEYPQYHNYHNQSM